MSPPGQLALKRCRGQALSCSQPAFPASIPSQHSQPAFPSHPECSSGCPGAPHVLLSCCRGFYLLSAAAFGIPSRAALKQKSSPRPGNETGTIPGRECLLTGAWHSTQQWGQKCAAGLRGTAKISKVLEASPLRVWVPGPHVGTPACSVPAIVAGEERRERRTKRVPGAFSQKRSTLGSLKMNSPTGCVTSGDCLNINIRASDCASPSFHTLCGKCSMNK